MKLRRNKARGIILADPVTAGLAEIHRSQERVREFFSTRRRKRRFRRGSAG